MKKLLDNKFWKQGNLPEKISLTKIPKLRGETNLCLILLSVLSGEKVLEICWLGQKFQVKKKQMGDLVVVRKNAAKFEHF